MRIEDVDDRIIVPVRNLNQIIGIPVVSYEPVIFRTALSCFDGVICTINFVDALLSVESLIYDISV